MTDQKQTEADEEMVCLDCDGLGYVNIYRDRNGNIDFYTGKRTDETTQCDACKGDGVL